MTERTYLDVNASAPLRPEARAAMLAAMDVAGNPSSPHADGRAARKIVDQARAAVAALAGCARDEVIFTAGATEAINIALLAPRLTGEGLRAPPHRRVVIGATDHAAVTAAAAASGAEMRALGVDETGRSDRPDLAGDAPAMLVQSAANSESGLVDLGALAAGAEACAAAGAPRLLDATQLLGKAAFAPGGDDPIRFSCGAPFGSAFTALSAHKIGGPKGVGALIFREGLGAEPPIFPHGGGQEFRRRSGTENVIGIAGFGAAAAALLETPPDWRAIRDLRDRLEAEVARLAPEAAFVRPVAPGAGVARLANTSLFATPGWKSDAQVIQLDLGGVSVSAGSACSSGKMTENPVVAAMGFGEDVAGGAIRVSLGPDASGADVDRFLDVWGGAYARFAERRGRS